MKTINTAFIIDYLDLGGTETQLYTLLRGLNRKRFFPIVICLKEKGRVAKKIEALGIPVYEIFKDLFFLPRFMNRFFQTLFLAGLLRLHKIEVVQTYLITANIFGTIAAKLAGVKVLCASERGVMNTDREDLPGRNLVFQRLSRWIDVVYGNSELVVEYLRNRVRIPTEKLRCIHNGIPLDKYQQRNGDDLRQELRLPGDIKLIGIIGRLISQKNHFMLFRAAQLIRECYPNFKIVVIGDGTCRKELEEQTKIMGLDEYVIFLGNRSDVATLLPSIDIVVQSSNFEGLPNVIMEAMAASRPVVATDAGGTRELVIHRETGFLVPCGDHQLLASRVSSLLLNPEKMKYMGMRGKRHIQKHFSMERLISKTENLYTELLESKISGTS